MGRWGANPSDWMHFEDLGLGADMLPVVSNPNAQISPDSRIKQLGKTPSRYNGDGLVTGIAKWTDQHSTPRQIAAWRKEPDYGICLQTRSVRALDIDVPDVSISNRIAAQFVEQLGLALPVRSRPDSGKQLLAFVLAEGPISKRSFKVEGGLVEFLADGQQFIAAGTHPNGTRYEWAGGLPDELPVVDAAAFERAWGIILGQFAVEPERRGRRHAGGGVLAGDRRGSDADPEGRGEQPGAGEDPVADWLEENWPNYGVEGGQLFIECPWIDGHSMDSGETQTSWLLAGTEGYAQGHFSCLHASCAGRKDGEFFRAVGYRDALIASFPALPAEEPGSVEAAQSKAESTAIARTASGKKIALPIPGFARSKNGEIDAVIQNVVRALRHGDMIDVLLGWDTFRGELMIQDPPGNGWRPYTDQDNTELRIRLATEDFKPVAKEMLRDAANLVGHENEFDSAQEWLEGLPAWDGVERVSTFFSTHFGVARSAYVDAVGRYAWTAQAGRVMDPGCKADMIPVLAGEQGQLKSWGLSAMAPSEDFFAEINLELRDDDLSRLMRGTLVAEIAELRGLNTRAAESIKAWVTKRFEKWTPKYVEYAITFPRRLIFYGTINGNEFLADETGERRWLPMLVESKVDVEAVIQDRDQLWAEGLARWREGGIAFREAEDLAKAEHGKFRVSDIWEEKVAHYLDLENLDGTSPRSLGWVKITDVMRDALQLEPRSYGRREEMRVSRILQALGLSKGKIYDDGRQIRAYVFSGETT